MELEEYNYEIVYRPDVQDETLFENKVFTVLHGGERENIIMKQGQDQVIRKATKRMR